MAIIYVFFKLIASIMSNTLGTVICNFIAVTGTIILLAYFEVIWARYNYVLSLEQLLWDGSGKFVEYSGLLSRAYQYRDLRITK